MQMQDESLSQCNSAAAGLGWGQRRCLSNELPGDAGAVGPWTALEGQDLYTFVKSLEHNNARSINVPICRATSKSPNGTRQNQRYKNVGLVNQSWPGIPIDCSCQNIIPRHEQITVFNN